jgi:pyruvate formate lyase activating enzyme
MTISRLRMGIDGKGVTTLVCSPGCPLHCRYCINKKILAENKFENVTAKDLVEKVRCDHLYYCATGGGITFGGGESLLEASFFSYFLGVPNYNQLPCPIHAFSTPTNE